MPEPGFSGTMGADRKEVGDMKKWKGVACAAAFALLCAGVWLFFQPLTETKGAIPYIDWESSVIVDAGGEESPLDILSGQPELGPGERFRFSLALPSREASEYLVFETAGGDITLLLDGKPIYASQIPRDEDSLDSTQALVILPPGGGEELVMELVPTGPLAIFPPLLRLTEDPTNQAETMAYANYYAIPAAFSALTMLLVCGLFLLRLYEKAPSWGLLLVAFAAAVSVTFPLAQGFGANFFPPLWRQLFGWQWWPALQILALAVFLLLHRDKMFWKGIGLVAGASAAGFLLLWAVSLCTGGYLARYMATLWSQLSLGIFSNVLYWLSFWMIMVCALVSGWYFIRAIIRAQAENRALQLKDQLLLENYHSLETRLQEAGQLRHESSHQLAAMDALLQEGNLERLGELLKRWREEVDQLASPYCQNHVVNAILQNTAQQAKAHHISFSAKTRVPESLPIPHEDLCAFLMNLLENAVEAASQAEPSEERFIHFQISEKNGFLAIQCENSFQGLLAEIEGDFPTNKSHPELHGFGIAKMRAVAEKYHSILDIRYTDTVFTVQTALKLPEEG